MRFTLAAFALLVTLAPAVAVDFTSPKAVVEALYEPYLQPADSFDTTRLDDDPYLSAGLLALYARDLEAAGGGIGRLDFDPYVNGQDFQLADLVVGEPFHVGGRAVVGVSFKNFEQWQDMGYLLVKEGDAWKIDDMWASASDYPYDLKDILSAPLSQ